MDELFCSVFLSVFQMKTCFQKFPHPQFSINSTQPKGSLWGSWLGLFQRSFTGSREREREGGGL